MSKQSKYAKMFTQRADGRYQTKYKDSTGKWRTVIDRDPEKLYYKIEELKKPKKVLFGEILDKWQEEHDKEVGYKCAESYVAPCRRLRQEFGETPIEDITPQDIRNLFDKLEKQGFAKRSVRLHKSALSLVFNYAIYNKIIDHSPVPMVKVSRNLRVTERTAPEEEQIRLILDNPNTPFALFAIMAYYTGLRRGELLALTYEDINRKQLSIRVNKAVTYQGETPIVKAPKTEAGGRTVHFPAPLLDYIPKNGSGIIFAGKDGLLRHSEFRTAWKHYADAIGISFTPHQIRHNYATLLVENDVPVLAAASQLGHSDVRTTMGVYAHLRAQQVKKANDIIDNAFGANLVSKAAKALQE